MSKFIFKSFNVVSAPKPIGPYSSGVRVNDTLYLSGVIGIDAKTDKLVNGGIISETEQIFKNIEILLKANDSSFNKGLVNAKIYLDDISNAAVVNEIYQKYIKPPFPARCMVEVTKLPLNAKIEVEVMALINQCRL
ncbi:hypothetical protein PGB90_008054 [Kerria lacca]